MKWRILPVISGYRKDSGYTLIEILISLGLLSIIIVLLISGLSGRKTEAEHLSDYFTAMFIAQKVIEDIENRVMLNPHFFKELGFDTEAKKVVDGCSPFFRYIEDTTADGKLNRDLPIVKEAGKIYDQLEKYSVRVEAEEVKKDDRFIDGLKKVTVTVLWNSGGVPREYRLETNVAGPREECVKPQVPPHVPGEIYEEIKKEFYGTAEAGDIETVAMLHGGDGVTVKNIGLIVLAVKGLVEINKSVDRAIEKLSGNLGRNYRDQIKIGKLYEEKAYNIMQSLNYLREPVEILASKIENGSFLLGELATAENVEKYLPYLIVLKKSHGEGREPASLIIEDFIKEISNAISAHFIALTDRSYSEEMPERVKQYVLFRIIDLAKVLFLNNRNYVCVNLPGQGQKTVNVRTLVCSSLLTLFRYYDGYDYNRAEFVAKELEAVKSVESLRERYPATSAKFDEINRALEKVIEIEKEVVKESLQNSMSPANGRKIETGGEDK